MRAAARGGARSGADGARWRRSDGAALTAAGGPPGRPALEMRRDAGAALEMRAAAVRARARKVAPLDSGI